MFEAVHVAPDGDSSAATVAATAAECGFDGVVVRNHGGSAPKYDRESIADETGIDVVDGVEIRAEEPSRVGGFIGNHRPETTVLLVHGGSPELNRYVVTQDRVDVLAHPMRGDGDLDHVLVRRATEHGVRLEIDLSPVLRSRGGRRVRAIGKLRKQRELIEDAGAPYVVSADARSHLQLRAPRDLFAVGEVIGFERDQIRDGLAEWKRIAAHNRERQADSFIGPGVRRGRYEENG